MDFIIRNTSVEEIKPIRNEILRPGNPIESCDFEGDSLATTKHFACYLDKEIIGACSLYNCSPPNIVEIPLANKKFQLRGMAIKSDYQCNGVGRKLINFIENNVRENHTYNISLWFNARVSAEGFYHKLGYIKSGAPFEIPKVGTHIMMYKNLY